MLILQVLRNASAARTTQEAYSDVKVDEFLQMEDPDIVVDMQELNHYRSDKYKVF